MGPEGQAGSFSCSTQRSYPPYSLSRINNKKHTRGRIKGSGTMSLMSWVHPNFNRGERRLHVTNHDVETKRGESHLSLVGSQVILLHDENSLSRRSALPRSSSHARTLPPGPVPSPDKRPSKNGVGALRIGLHYKSSALTLISNSSLIKQAERSEN